MAALSSVMRFFLLSLCERSHLSEVGFSLYDYYAYVSFDLHNLERVRNYRKNLFLEDGLIIENMLIRALSLKSFFF